MPDIDDFMSDFVPLTKKFTDPGYTFIVILNSVPLSVFSSILPSN